ncbi:MAG: CotH kinase family protein, partial [Akkermansiaceae bacterium]|nr:CotH kinase family protein [Akkermansiaceae bacterium]
AAPNWTAAAYDDSSWSQASGPGLGFEAGVPVAYWRFDEGAGTTMAEDASGNGHHGSLTGSAAFGAAGQSLQTETAVSFANTLGKVTIPHSPALNPATFTFAAWVYPAAATGDYQSVITSRRGTSPSIGYVLYITPGGSWTFWTRGNSGGWSTLDGPAVSFGQWSHVAISRDAAGMNRLFVNGSEVTAAAGSYAPNPSSPLHFGAGNHDGSQFRLNGRIDDATFWKTALGTTLIQQHRDATGGSFPTAAYGGHYQTNVQDAMETVNPGLYARYSFTLADPATLASLSLRVKYDDGFIAFLNGTEVVRKNAIGTRVHDSVADSDRSDSAAVVWEETDLTANGLPLLVAGQNTLAIHAMRRSLAHPDFLLTPELRTTRTETAAAGYFATATPGQANSALTSPGPEIMQVSHTPAEPLPDTSITVTARVKPRLAPIQSVSLTPRVQYNPEGAPLAMTDSGPWPGATDGSRLFTVIVPSSGGAAARQMFRYFLTATDSAARSWRAPFITDTSNDDGKSQSPQYYGTVVRDTTLGTPAMPVLQWFTQDVPNSDTRTGSRASCFYQGQFYDNIYVRQRGGYTSWGSQKFNFNRGDGLYVDEILGNVGEVNMNSAGADSTYLRPLLAFDLWRQCGHEAPAAHLVAMYRNGSFHRMSSMIEQVDEDLLERYGLDPEGALYKFVQRVGETPLPGGDYSNSPALGDTIYGVEKKTRLHEDLSDLNALVAGINQTDAAVRNAYLFRHLNIPNFVNFMAVRNLTGDGDTNRKNFYLHRDSNHSGEWRLIPWDKDFTFGVYYGGNTPNPWNATRTYYGDPGGTNQWCVLFEAGYQNPWIREMVARRIRQLADATIGPPGTPSETTLLEARLETIRATFTPLPTGV